MTAADFRAIALSLEGVEEYSHAGLPAFHVGGRKFASLASQADGYGNLALTLDQQAAFVEEAPEIFLPIPGGWGKMGHTHIRLTAASEDIVMGALRTAWKLRIEKNAKTGRKNLHVAELERSNREATRKVTTMTRARNMNINKKDLSPKQRDELLSVLKARFQKNMNRHPGLEWAPVQAKLQANTEKLWSLNEMERTGGEPDVVGHDRKAGEYIFWDCSAESPKGRRSVCYDREALESRKEHKPKNSAADMAAAMGIELLTEENYRELQKLGDFDTKTSSWVKTPAEIRKLGGALFCDRRFNTVFVYHNGAESYYAARAFRGSLRV